VSSSTSSSSLLSVSYHSLSSFFLLRSCRYARTLTCLSSSPLALSPPSLEEAEEERYKYSRVAWRRRRAAGWLSSRSGGQSSPCDLVGRLGEQRRQCRIDDEFERWGSCLLLLGLARSPPAFSEEQPPPRALRLHGSVSFLYPAAVSLSTFPLLSALPSSLSLSRPLSLVGIVIKRVVLGLPVEVVGLNRVAARCGVWRLQ